MLFEIYLRTDMKVSFKQFKDENLERISVTNTKQRSREEILTQVKDILDGFGKEET